MTDVSRNGPNLWRAMLEELGLPGAVVAGGCIRDWQLGVEPKDIDICVPVSNASDFRAIVEKLSDNRYFDVRDMFDREEYEADCGPDLIGVMEGEGFGLPVNIIARTAHLQGPQALVDSFDFDILQAYHDGTRTHFSPGFLLACDRGVATMAHGRHIEQSIKRFLRFNARHPGRLSLNIPFDMEIDFAKAH